MGFEFVKITLSSDGGLVHSLRFDVIVAICDRFLFNLSFCGSKWKKNCLSHMAYITNRSKKSLTELSNDHHRMNY